MIQCLWKFANIRLNALHSNENKIAYKHRISYFRMHRTRKNVSLGEATGHALYEKRSNCYHLIVSFSASRSFGSPWLFFLCILAELLLLLFGCRFIYLQWIEVGLFILVLRTIFSQIHEIMNYWHYSHFQYCCFIFSLYYVNTRWMHL